MSIKPLLYTSTAVHLPAAAAAAAAAAGCNARDVCVSLYLAAVVCDLHAHT